MRAQIGFVVFLLVAALVVADGAQAWGRKETQAYYGELHLHTAISTDAWFNGTLDSLWRELPRFQLQRSEKISPPGISPT